MQTMAPGQTITRGGRKKRKTSERRKKGKPYFYNHNASNDICFIYCKQSVLNQQHTVQRLRFQIRHHCVFVFKIDTNSFNYGLPVLRTVAAVDDVAVVVVQPFPNVCINYELWKCSFTSTNEKKRPSWNREKIFGTGERNKKKQQIGFEKRIDSIKLNVWTETIEGLSWWT